MKGIELTKEQIAARNNGATMLLFPIITEETRPYQYEGISNITNQYMFKVFDELELIMEDFGIEFPLKEGEEFFISIEEDCIGDCLHGLPCLYCGSSYGQGKVIVKDKDTALNVEVKRVQDIDLDSLYKMGMKKTVAHADCFYIDTYLKEQGINYEETPYVFTVTIKGINND